LDYLLDQLSQLEGKLKILKSNLIEIIPVGVYKARDITGVNVSDTISEALEQELVPKITDALNEIGPTFIKFNSVVIFS
jgi:predicted unusual protein kinase regulating ubiquinone biosynthesis (AarF/ABC1/UbiB family)